MGRTPSSKTLPIPFLPSSPALTGKIPVSRPTLPVLSWLPSLELEGTVEREVDGNALLDVAPDHQSLLISDWTIEGVR
ncbi:hypothetical protein K443DRAFT_686645 [Laccaria amethystina LaAM-08-1]|jgi:hypothetical protein|uniref:Uncharacterized protein n=1 Tax=Laccaria amethystina LaAM-08-1 TaxID=1095629 RepID=A0A0C9WH59_9AGAR|nr:hypothetical protein K443DRAFT_686645 [Laccaria amethystina LaAM-08-1]